MKSNPRNFLPHETSNPLTNESKCNFTLVLIAISVDNCLMLKSDCHVSKKSFYFQNENPIKVMKNTFSLILEALFVLKIFKFLSWLFWSYDKSKKVNFKTYDDTVCEYTKYCLKSQEVKVIRQWIFFFFKKKKALFDVKASGLHLSFLGLGRQ